MLPLLLAGTALAWSPGVHRAMAARAAELEAALPGGPSADEARRFARAAAGEDLNLVRKWSSWHHYYVETPLGVRRPSPERVAWLEARIATVDRATAWQLAGLAVHHVQDMASPPHVVPVHHGLGDGFEGYEVTTFLADSLAAPDTLASPTAAQASLVALTRAALLEPIVCEDFHFAPTLELWVTRPGRAFGGLGPLRFGDVPGCDAGFDAFARARVDAAVAFTRAVVRWVAGLYPPDAAVQPPDTTTRTPIDPPL